MIDSGDMAGNWMGTVKVYLVIKVTRTSLPATHFPSLELIAAKILAFLRQVSTSCIADLEQGRLHLKRQNKTEQPTNYGKR